MEVLVLRYPLFKTVLYLLFVFWLALVDAVDYRHHEHLPSVSTEQIEKDLRPFSSGILLEDVEESSHLGQFRVVIKDNMIFIGPTDALNQSVENDLEHAVIMLIAKALCYEKVADVEFILNIGDLPGLRASENAKSLPVMSWSKSEGYNDIFFPYWSLTWLHPVPETFQQSQWNLKRDLAVWRGSTTGGIWTESSWRNLTRAKLSRKCNARPDLCDAKINGYVQGAEGIQEIIKEELGSAPHMPLDEMCGYKYVIVVNGNGPASSRLVTLLRQCRSLLFIQETPFRLFWMAGFQPFVHYVPLAENLEDLYDRIEWAKANDAAARRIAANAHEFALKHLNDAFVSHYLIELFRRYAELQKFVVDVRPGMHKLPVPTAGWNYFFDYMGDRCHHFARETKT